MLLAAVHFLIFVSIVRFYSAVTDRDALFLSMLSFAGILAAAVLTVDTTFLILFFIFSCSVFPLSSEWNCAGEPPAPFRPPSTCTPNVTGN